MSPAVKTVPAMPATTFAVALSAVRPHDAMSPAPTSTTLAAAVGDGEGVGAGLGGAEGGGHGGGVTPVTGVSTTKASTSTRGWPGVPATRISSVRFAEVGQERLKTTCRAAEVER